MNDPIEIRHGPEDLDRLFQAEDNNRMIMVDHEPSHSGGGVGMLAALVASTMAGHFGRRRFSIPRYDADMKEAEWTNKTGEEARLKAEAKRARRAARKAGFSKPAEGK